MREGGKEELACGLTCIRIPQRRCTLMISSASGTLSEHHPIPSSTADHESMSGAYFAYLRRGCWLAAVPASRKHIHPHLRGVQPEHASGPPGVVRHHEGDGAV